MSFYIMLWKKIEFQLLMKVKKCLISTLMNVLILLVVGMISFVILCIESNREDNIKKANDDNNEPLSYPWYDYNSPDFYSNILLGVTTVTAIMAVTCCIIKIN